MQQAGKASTSTRGFASMDRDKQREIARKGGRSVPNEKRSFSQNHQLASEAGRKGGHSSHGRRRAAARHGGLSEAVRPRLRRGPNVKRGRFAPREIAVQYPRPRRNERVRPGAFEQLAPACFPRNRALKMKIA